jgi:signal transduction histidine kinase
VKVREPLSANRGWFERGIDVFFVAVTVVSASRNADSGTLIAAITLLALYAARVPIRNRRWSEIVWLSVLTGAWLAAVLFVTVDFVWVSVPLMFLYLLTLPLRFAVAVVAAITAIVIAAEAVDDDGLLAAEVVGPILGAGFAIVACVSYRRLASEFEHTQRVLTELEAARDELARSQHERGMLDERRRMAREVHDTIAQDLAGILLIVRSPDTANSASRIEDLATTALHEARRIVDALGPIELVATPLPTALAQLAANDTERRPDIVFEVSGEPRDVPQPLQAMLLRVAQGALANIREHAQASTAYITLSYLDDEVAIDIVDDGHGFTPCDTTHRNAGSFGLSVMRDRAQQVGGTLVVESRPGAGTAIHAAVPTP